MKNDIEVKKMEEFNYKKELATEEMNDILLKLGQEKVWKDLQDKGIDPVDIIAKNIKIATQLHKSPQMKLAFLKSLLVKEFKIQTASNNRGIVLGTCDDINYSEKAPLTVIMLNNDDELKTYAVFNQNLITHNGIYTFDATSDDNGRLSVRAVLERAEFKDNPANYIIESSHVMTTDDERWNELSNNFPPVIVRGYVRSIRPNPIFATVDGKSVVNGYEPIYQLNCASPAPLHHPTFTMVLDNNGGTYNVNVNFRRCRYGMPYFGFSDIDTVFEYANNTTADPEEQISIVAHMFEGREVIVIGTVTSMRERTDRDNVVSTMVNIRGVACLCIDDIPYFDYKEYERRNICEHVSENNSEATPTITTGSPTGPGQSSNAEQKSNVTVTTESPTKSDESVVNETAAPVEESKPKVSSTRGRKPKTETPVVSETPETSDAELIVDAKVVDKPVETTADAATVNGERYPNYSIDSETLVNNIVEDVLRIVQILKTPANVITKNYVSSTLTLGERTDIPEVVWDIILERIVNGIE